MGALHPDDPRYCYEEFSMLDENCTEHGLTRPDLAVDRRTTFVGRDRVSMLHWGQTPEVLFLHGTAQNAHTWDTVALSLGRSAIAVDLPGHGHSDWRTDHRYDPETLAKAVKEVCDDFSIADAVVVGMSLGGLVANSLVARWPSIARAVIAVDITPGTTAEGAHDILQFINGPQDFGSFEEIFSRTQAFNPTRSPASLRRGILHNAQRGADGTWTWRYDRHNGMVAGSTEQMWERIASIECPYSLARGGLSPVVADSDIERLMTYQPTAEVVTFAESGHSIQGDQPLELAAFIEEHCD